MGQLLREAPHRGRCQHRAHAQVLEGRNEEGGWNTAAAKTYPPFCRFLAESIFVSIQGQFVGSEGPPPSELEESVAPFFVPLDPFYEFQRGRDFAHSGTTST